MSDRLPVPRFDPDARTPVRLVERRGRLLVIAAGALLVALIASSVANASRVGLRCVEGQLVPYQGSFMPAGEEPLDDPGLPPLPVPTAACEDEDLGSLSELRARHREIARSRVDEVIRREGREPLEPSTLDAAMVELPAGADEEAIEQRRALLQSIVDAKVERARQSQDDALRWIEQARLAGVDPAYLRAAERMLGLPTSSTEPPPPESAKGSPRLGPPSSSSAEAPAEPSPTSPPRVPAVPRSL